MVKGLSQRERSALEIGAKLLGGLRKHPTCIYTCRAGA